MRFYIYENWVVEGHKARIHQGSCGNCQEGKGKHRNAGTRNGRWHGPFASINDATIAAQKTGGNVSYCKRCLPNAVQTR